MLLNVLFYNVSIYILLPTVEDYIAILSAEDFGNGTLTLELAFRNFRLKTLAWKSSFWGTFAWEL